jgi:hypothetical protein
MNRLARAGFGKSVVALVLCVSAGCASMAQKGALSFVYKDMQKGKYDVALRDLSRAEHHKLPSPVMAAEITFLRAECYDRMGRVAEAKGAYSFTVDSFPDTVYGRMAQERLNMMKLPAEVVAPAQRSH